MILIHPTHKKFIKLLRDKANAGTPIIITKNDCKDFSELIKSTNARYKRHQGVYKITLRAMNRPRDEINVEEIQTILDNNVIDYIEKIFSRLERKQLCATLKGAYIRPIFLALLKLLNKKINV